MTFDNGMTISVQFGTGNYCERRSFTISNPYHDLVNQNVTESPDAEIAIWDANDKWFIFGDDEVMGCVKPDEVAKWISVTQHALNLNDLKDLAIGFGLVFNH
jgi:hypothetical protein